MYYFSAPINYSFYLMSEPNEMAEARLNSCSNAGIDSKIKTITAQAFSYS